MAFPQWLGAGQKWPLIFFKTGETIDGIVTLHGKAFPVKNTQFA
jgi:hypothetical protein